VDGSDRVLISRNILTFIQINGRKPQVERSACVRDEVSTPDTPTKRNQWRTEGGGALGISNTPPPPEIPKALQNRAKLNQIVKTVKHC